MMTKARIGLALVGAALVAALIVYGRRGATPTQTLPDKATAEGPSTPSTRGGLATERLVPVTVTKVERRDVPVYLHGLGTVTSLATVTVRSQVTGRLERVSFKEGARIRKGEPIAQIDPRQFRIQLAQAEAALTRDEAQLRNGQLNLERNETLRAGNLVAQQEVDNQRALVAQLDAAVRTDHAQVAQARLMIDYANITSPISGVTGVRLVDPGNLVQAGESQGIVVITQLDPIALLFTLPQDDLHRVQGALRRGHLTVRAYARDGVELLGEGELALVDNQVNAETATIRLKAIVPNPEQKLWPNAFVKVALHLDTVRGALVVPASVVQHGPNGTFGYVVSKDNVVDARPLVVETIEGDVALLSSGADEGETFVTDGQTQLKPGAKVAPRAGATGSRPPASSTPAPAAPSDRRAP